MKGAINPYLFAAGVLSALAALLHLGCIVFGAPWYRAFGAGERFAQLAESGSSHPARVTLVIALVLLLWAVYAFSAAGLIPRLPLLRLALCAIAAVYLARGIFGFLLAPYFPGNSLTFWVVSCAICFAIGVLHAIGLRQVWAML
ncbi:MAG: hypothetical protein E6R11_00585 [Rhodocyclaceae bacterium]|nr:MAG: hypothetical protein EYC71_09325 [Gammaproteobacteria bacterium]TXG80713.1 MAG: hypothetical protein E6R11_00585 [Rhodocyclaceae bacterium]